ncbi:MAG: hypothetical protein PHV32_10190, partial [Eubacteriales bacterium]|nr:hypothetical protein [Eubacteriales bacterium]
LAPIAACLLLAAAIAIPLLNIGDSDFDLKLSDGVKVSYTDKIPANTQEADLMQLTEDELFSATFNQYEIVAFEGIVKEARNIVCDYNGNKDYRAIVSIKVSDVLRGNLDAGTTVDVLLPAPVGSGIQVEDTSIASQITVGTTGIFMPIKYNETSIREENGKTLALLDLADYGLPDGERWIFLETANGLVYSTYAYPSLTAAKTLEEAKTIILTKVK